MAIIYDLIKARTKLQRQKPQTADHMHEKTTYIKH